MKPKEITRETDSGLNTASFGYYEGVAYAKEHNLKFTTSFSNVRNGGHYLVCCGDVMTKVEPTDFPNIPRRDM